MTIDLYYHLQENNKLPKNTAAMVFIHGSFATTATWKKYTEILSEHHLCVSIKLPGHGGAPQPCHFSNPSLNEELVLLSRIVKHLNLTNIHLVGHSYGAVVALSIAAQQQLPIKQLTLFEPVAVWALNTKDTAQQYQQVLDFIHSYKTAVNNNESYACKRVIDFWGGDGAFASLPEFIQNNMQTMTKNNLRHWDICINTSLTNTTLNHLNIPVHIVCGDQSNPLLLDIAKLLIHQLPNSQLSIIPDASHFLVTTHSDDCIRFLQT